MKFNTLHKTNNEMSTEPSIADSLDERINDNFQVLSSASWFCLGIVSAAKL